MDNLILEISIYFTVRSPKTEKLIKLVETEEGNESNSLLSGDYTVYSN